MRPFKTFFEYDKAMKEIMKLHYNDEYVKVRIHMTHLKMIEYLGERGITNLEILKNNLIKQ